METLATGILTAGLFEIKPSERGELEITSVNNIFLEISNNQAIKPNVPKRNLTLKEKIKHFDPQKKYQNIALRDIFSQYAHSSRNMQLKMVYTFIYRYSLMTEQKKKESYYNNRGITCDVKEIGFLGWEDVTRLEQELTKYFSIQDLQDFKVFSKKKYGCCSEYTHSDKKDKFNDCNSSKSHLTTSVYDLRRTLFYLYSYADIVRHYPFVIYLQSQTTP